MLIDNKIISRLANQALEQSYKKNELKAFLVQQSEESIQYWEENDYESAIVKINSAIDIAPNLSFLKVMKSLYYCSSNQAQISNELINSISTTQLNELELRMVDFIKSCNCIHLQQYLEAIDYASNIIKQNPKSYFAYLPRAIAYQELDKQNEAISDFKMALKEQIQIKGIKAGIAFSYLKKRKTLKALLLHLSVIKHFHNNFRVNHNIGVNYFMLNWNKRALKHVNKALQLKKDFGDAYRTRGLIYLTQGKVELANQELQKAKDYGAKDIEKTISRLEKQLKNKRNNTV